MRAPAGFAPLKNRLCVGSRTGRSSPRKPRSSTEAAPSFMDGTTPKGVAANRARKCRILDRGMDSCSSGKSRVRGACDEMGLQSNSGARLRAACLCNCARIILNATSHSLNSLVLIRLQLLSSIAAWPRMTQPWLRIRSPNLPLANGRLRRSHLRASVERRALKAQRRDFFEWSCPWRSYP
jgi:hypothetical protein